MRLKFLLLTIMSALIIQKGSSKGFPLQNIPSDQIIELIYNYQFDEAEKMIISNKDNLSTILYELLSLDLKWWKCISENSLREFRESLEIADHKMSAGTKNDNYFLQIIHLSYKIRYEMAMKNRLAVLPLLARLNKLINNADEFINTSDQLEVQLIELYRNLLLYVRHYLIDALNVFDIDKTKRLKYLILIEKNSSGQQPIVRILCHHFLGKIYLEFERDNAKAKNHFLFLNQWFPSNLAFKSLLELCN